MEQNPWICFRKFLIRIKDVADVADVADAVGAQDVVGVVAVCNKRYGDKQNDGKDDREHGDDHGKLRADAAAKADVVAMADAVVAGPSQILR